MKEEEQRDSFNVFHIFENNISYRILTVSVFGGISGSYGFFSELEVEFKFSFASPKM